METNKGALVPRFLQAVHNNYSEGIQTVGFERQREDLILHITEGSRPYSIRIGMGESSAQELEYHHETYQVAVLGEAVLGAGYADQSHPVYTIARLGGVSVFRRLDAVHVSIWMLLALLRLMLSVWALWQILDGLLPTARSRWILVAGGGALAALLALCTAQQLEWVCGGLLALTLAAALLPKRRKTG